MRRTICALSGVALMSIIASSVFGDPLMPSGPEDEISTKKINSLIGRTFSEYGGNAFGSGLVSVGFAPYSRSVVVVYFVNTVVNYGKSTILPTLAADTPNYGAIKEGRGFEVAYVNCKLQTYSALSYPLASSLSNVESSWFVKGSANRWDFDASLQKSPKWALYLPAGSRDDIANFFSDLCEATN